MVFRRTIIKTSYGQINISFLTPTAWNSLTHRLQIWAHGMKENYFVITRYLTKKIIHIQIIHVSQFYFCLVIQRWEGAMEIRSCRSFFELSQLYLCLGNVFGILVGFFIYFAFWILLRFFWNKSAIVFMLLIYLFKLFIWW